MALVYRDLTVNFARSVKSDGVTPEAVRVVLTALSTPSHTPTGTLVQAPDSQEILLGAATTAITFSVVPSNHPDLTESVRYRIAWRVGGPTGRTYTYDFAMPDADISFEEIVSLDYVIGGEVYLQQDDLGVPGRVAKLDDDGNVIDSVGNILSTQDALNVVAADLAQEIIDSVLLNAALEDSLTDDIASAVAASAVTDAANLAAAVSTLNDADTNLAIALANLNAGVDLKADLVDGVVPFDQIPDEALATVTDVADEDEMLALPDATGDFALQADGSLWMLTGADPADIGDWTAVNPVRSVNGLTGAIILSLADITTGSIATSRVTGLDAALTNKTETSVTSALDDRVTAIEEDDTIVRTNGGVIDQSQVDGLEVDLSTLDGRISDIESGDPGTKVVWFDGAAATGDFAADLTLYSPFGYNPLNPNANADGYYFDPAGAASGEERFPYLTPNGHLELRVWDEDAVADLATATQDELDALGVVVATKADQDDFDLLVSDVADKAEQSEVDSLASTVADKADTATVSALSDTVDTKADQTDLDTLESTVGGHTTQLLSKADLSGGKVLVSQIPTGIPQANIESLDTTLAAKADLDGTTLDLTQVPTGIPTASIDGLDGALADKADLDGEGKVLANQLPALALTTVYTVISEAAMLALDAVQGNVCVITEGDDQGTYILADTDPTILANWVPLTAPTNTVQSVNGQTGIVSLDADDVGSPSDAEFTAALADKVDTAVYEAGIADKTSSSDVQDLISTTIASKQQVTYVSTANIASLSGPQKAEAGGGADLTMAVGSTVLLTGQTTATQNGLWTVNSGAWTRRADMATDSYLLQGSIVTISSTTATNGATIWQATSATGVVGTDANVWSRVGYIDQRVMLTGGDGVAVTGTYPNKVVAAVADTGCIVTADGIGVDTDTIPRKWVGQLPAGTTVTVTHSLGTKWVIPQVIEISSGTGVLIGWQAINNNQVQFEFSTAQPAGTWQAIIIA